MSEIHFSLQNVIEGGGVIGHQPTMCNTITLCSHLCILIPSMLFMAVSYYDLRLGSVFESS